MRTPSSMITSCFPYNICIFCIAFVSFFFVFAQSQKYKCFSVLMSALIPVVNEPQ